MSLALVARVAALEARLTEADEKIARLSARLEEIERKRNANGTNGRK